MKKTKQPKPKPQEPAEKQRYINPTTQTIIEYKGLKAVKDNYLFEFVYIDSDKPNLLTTEQDLSDKLKRGIFKPIN